MARPQKQGLDYFPMDVDMDLDDKMGMIIAEFGSEGEKAFTKLLCWIYKHEGYFAVWDEAGQLRFMRRYSYCGFSLSFIKNEVVPRCIKWGLFDRSVFESSQILTSIRIQETWLEVSRKRIGRVYKEKYWLIGVCSAVKPEQTELIPEVISKVKERKLNESKGKEVLAPEVPPPPLVINPVPVKENPPDKKNTGAKKFTAPGLQDAKDFFLKTIGNPRKPGHWPADKCENEAGKYFNHYTANGWKQGRGKPIVDWEAAARNWITNEREGAFSNSPVAQKQSSPASEQKPVLSKNEVEINYLYDKYCEDPALFTTIDIDQIHYNLLKNTGFISFSNDKVEEIKNEATEYMKVKSFEVNDASLLKHMKKFGVLHFFKQHAGQGKETVFEI